MKLLISLMLFSYVGSEAFAMDRTVLGCEKKIENSLGLNRGFLNEMFKGDAVEFLLENGSDLIENQGSITQKQLNQMLSVLKRPDSHAYSGDVDDAGYYLVVADKNCKVTYHGFLVYY
jgi:hypothetical protein